MMKDKKNVGHCVRTDKSMPSSIALMGRLRDTRLCLDIPGSSTHYFNSQVDVSYTDYRHVPHPANLNRSTGFEGYISCGVFSCAESPIEQLLNSGDA